MDDYFSFRCIIAINWIGRSQ